MLNLPDNFEHVKLVYVQLHLCLKALDALGMELPAAHLDASISALRDQIDEGFYQTKLDQTLRKDFSELDMLIAQTLLPAGENGRRKLD